MEGHEFSRELSAQAREKEVIGSAIEPLSPEEERELQELCEKLFSYGDMWLDHGTKRAAEKAQWEIVQKFGERAVPIVLARLEKAEGNSQIEHCFGEILETLVTAKTAPLVLDALRKGSISVHYGALAAAESKDEKTIRGLGEVLEKTTRGSIYDRGPHTKLFEALAYTGREEAIPVLLGAWQNLRANPQCQQHYQDHQKDLGNDLYEHDAHEVIKSIAYIGGSKGEAALRKLAQSKDPYLMKAAEDALAHKLYVGAIKKSRVLEPKKYHQKDEYKDHAYPEEYSYPDLYPEELEQSPAKYFSPESTFKEKVSYTPTYKELPPSLKELSPKERLARIVGEENAELLDFAEGKLAPAQSLADLIRNNPHAQYIRIAEALEEMHDPEYQLRAGVLIGQYASFIAQTTDPKEREQLWSDFIESTGNLQGRLITKDSQAALVYHQAKEVLFGAATADSRGVIRKQITKGIAALAFKGNDPEIARALGQIVREMGREAREGKLRFSPHQELALRALLSLSDADTNNELARLLVADGIDARLKKLCLKNLNTKRHFESGGFYYMASDYGRLDSKSIPWQEFRFPVSVRLIADRRIRETIESRMLPDLTRLLRDKQGSLFDMWRTSAPRLSPELFVVCASIAGKEADMLRKFDELLGPVKGKAMREAYLIALTDFHAASRDRRGEKDNAVLKKIFSLGHDTRTPESMLKILNNIISIQDWKRRDKVIDKIMNARDVRDAVTVSEDEALGELFDNLPVGAQFFSREKLRAMIDGIGDPRPFLTYAAQLRHKEKDRRTLFAEMLAHIDPPTLQEWKQWRYDMKNPVVAEQIGFLTERQRSEYARDHFLEVGELFVSVLSSEKAQQIREAIAHSFLHEDHTAGAEKASGLNPVLAYCKRFFEANPATGAAFISGVREELNRLNSLSEAFGRISLLLKEDVLFARGKETLDRFLRKADERNKQLRALGLKGSESDEMVRVQIERIRLRELPPEIEKIIGALEQEGKIVAYTKLAKRLEYFEQQRGGKGIARIARFGKAMGEQEKNVRDELRPFESLLKERLGKNFRKYIEAHRRLQNLSRVAVPELDPDFVAFLKRRGWDEHVSEKDLAAGRDILQKELVELRASPITQGAKDFAPGIPETANELHEFLQNVSLVRNLLRISVLTPRLLAFDRIAEDIPKKAARLSRILEDLQKRLAAYPVLVRDLGDIAGKLKEASAPWKKEKLGMVITDHPLVGLTIGMYPYGAESCQKYTSGDNALLSYMTDALSKYAILVDVEKLPQELQEAMENAESEQERLAVFNAHAHQFLPAIVARRILKMVKKDDTAEPHLFLEPVYTPLERESITRHMDSLIKSELAPLLDMAPVKGVPERFGEKPEKSFQVRVGTSRNSREQYEDGASGGPGGAGGGLGTKTGSYVMPAALLEVA